MKHGDKLQRGNNSEAQRKQVVGVFMKILQGTFQL